MTKSNILLAIDQAMAALQAARKELAKTSQQVKGGAAKTGSTKKPQLKAAQGRRPMSEEGRERIAAAQRKRWAAQKKAAKKAARARA
jgi:hypothetical protein